MPVYRLVVPRSLLCTTHGCLHEYMASKDSCAACDVGLRMRWYEDVTHSSIVIDYDHPDGRVFLLSATDEQRHLAAQVITAMREYVLSHAST